MSQAAMSWKGARRWKRLTPAESAKGRIHRDAKVTLPDVIVLLRMVGVPWR